MTNERLDYLAEEAQDGTGFLHLDTASALELINALKEAKKLLFEAVDRYPVEKEPNLWSSRVRKWLKNE